MDQRTEVGGPANSTASISFPARLLFSPTHLRPHPCAQIAARVPALARQPDEDRRTRMLSPPHFKALCFDTKEKSHFKAI